MLAGVDVATFEAAALTDEQLHTFWKFSNSLMEEPEASFRNHSSLTDIVYVFSDRSSKEIIGLSYWRSLATSNPKFKMIIQGKLRIASHYRRRGLHLFAGLWYYVRQQLRSPRSTFIFISIASLYNFVSMRKSVYNYWLLNRSEHHAESAAESVIYKEVLPGLLRDDHFVTEENGAIFVGVRIAESVIAEFPPSFYRSTEATEYIAANPKWREAFDLAYAYPFSIVNVLFMVWRIAVLTVRWRLARLGLSDAMRAAANTCTPLVEQPERPG